MIQIKNLNKYYGDFQALKNINLEIKKGEIVGLLGPNGAGKTTLMKILTGCLTADEGECFINGVEIHEGPTFPVGSSRVFMGALSSTEPTGPSHAQRSLSCLARW